MAQNEHLRDASHVSGRVSSSAIIYRGVCQTRRRRKGEGGGGVASVDTVAISVDAISCLAHPGGPAALTEQGEQGGWVDARAGGTPRSVPPRRGRVGVGGGRCT